MNEKEYSDYIWETFPITDIRDNALGLCGEAGEFANKIKQRLYKDVPDEDIKKELADILWHLDQCARLMGTDLTELRQISIGKTASKNKKD